MLRARLLLAWLAACASALLPSAVRADATIGISTVPPYGVDGFITGMVGGVAPADFHVAPFLQIEGLGWYNKPTFASPTVAIADDGSYSADVATGGIDNRATIYCAALLPDDVEPPVANGAASLPAALDGYPVACRERYARILQFAGRSWAVKEAPVPVGPGWNRFSDHEGDVFVDEQGRLHLRIQFRDGHWRSVEVILLDRLGFGRYEFVTTSRVDVLDIYATFGAFTWDAYGGAEHSANREVDSEDSRWGNAGDPTTSQSVVQPFGVTGNLARYTVPDQSADATLTRYLRWTDGRVDFLAVRGLLDGEPAPEDVLHQRTYTEDAGANHFVPDAGRAAFRFNLWLNNVEIGQGATPAPAGDATIEVVIDDFRFVPACADSALDAEQVCDDGLACTDEACTADARCLHTITEGPLVCPAAGAPAALNSSATSDSGADVRPYVATDGAGTWMTVWHGNDTLGGTVGSDTDVFFSVSDDAGVSWSAMAPLNANATTDNAADVRAKVAGDGAGTWIAVWTSRNSLGGTIGNDFDVLCAVTTDDGTTWSSPRVVNSNAAADAAVDSIPEIATDADGTWIVAWQSTDSLGGTIGTDLDLLYSVSTDRGATWSPRSILNGSAATDAGASDVLVDLETDGAGQWLAVWSSKATLDGTIGSDFDILSARSTDDGASWSAPIPVNSFAAGPASLDKFARLAGDRSGAWLVVWASKDTLGNTIGADFDILSALSTDGGQTWSTAVPVNSTAADQPAGADSFPVVADGGDGSWLVAWHSNESSGGLGPDDDVLFARSYDGGQTWASAAPLPANASSDAGHDRFASIACDRGGNWSAAWQSTDTLAGTIGGDLDVLTVGVMCGCP